MLLELVAAESPDQVAGQFPILLKDTGAPSWSRWQCKGTLRFACSPIQGPDWTLRNSPFTWLLKRGHTTLQWHSSGGRRSCVRFRNREVLECPHARKSFVLKMWLPKIHLRTRAGPHLWDLTSLAFATKWPWPAHFLANFRHDFHCTGVPSFP